MRAWPNVIMHLEWELKGGPKMPKRMTEYALFLDGLLEDLSHRGKQLVSIVVYLDRKSYRPDPGVFDRLYSPGQRLRYSYRTVKLWELDPELVLAAELPGVWPFVPLMRGDPVKLLRVAREKILGLPDTMVNEEEKQKLLALLVGLASRVVEDRELLRRLQIEVRNMGDNYFLDLFVEDGRALGLKQGLKQGMEKGARAAGRNVLLRVLRRRFGEVSEDLQRRVEGLVDLDEIERLVEEAAVVPTLEAFTALVPQSRI